MAKSKDADTYFEYVNAEDYPESIGATKLTCAYGLAVPGFIDAWRHTTFAGGGFF